MNYSSKWVVNWDLRLEKEPVLQITKVTWSAVGGVLQSQALTSEDKHLQTGAMNHGRKINLNPEKDQHVYK